MDINWPEIISIVLSNAVLLATGFEKSMDKLVSKVETLDKHQLELHTKVAQYETRLNIIEKHCELRNK